MTENLLKPTWKDVDPAELRFILLKRIGEPGQYNNAAEYPYIFYLPLAGSSCQVKLTFSPKKQITAIERGPAFNEGKWAQVVRDVEQSGNRRVGRDISFNTYRVQGTWRGSRSGVQILPPPEGAPLPPYELADHPFLLEFPIIASDLWPITNYRRMREHKRLTQLLNILLIGSTTSPQLRRPRHFWATVAAGPGQIGELQWVQEFYSANFGEVVVDELSPATAGPVESVSPDAYYASLGIDGRPLRVPADLDDSICCYLGLSPENRAKFSRAAYWMDLGVRQWDMSWSASFACLVIAIEALGDKKLGAGARFREFIEKHAPGAALEERRKEFYKLRSDILHGDALMEIDQDAHFGWAPPEEGDRNLFGELSGLTRIAIRNWLKSP